MNKYSSIKSTILNKLKKKVIAEEEVIIEKDYNYVSENIDVKSLEKKIIHETAVLLSCSVYTSKVKK